MKKRKVFLFLTVTAIMAVIFGFSAFGASEKITLKMSNTSEGIKLSWNFDKENTYAVMKKSGDGKYEKLLRIKGGEYTDKSVVSGEKYDYYIKKNAFVKSDKKSITFLSAPKLISADNRSGGIKLVWTKVGKASNYAIMKKEKGGSWQKLLDVTNKTSYTDTKVKTGKKYAYYLIAKTDGAVSGKGNALTAWRLLSPKVAKISNTDTGVKITWNKTAGAAKYNIYRKASGENWKEIASVKNSDTLSYTDRSALSGTKYSYTVKALNGDSKSQGVEGQKSILYLEKVKNLSLNQNGKNVRLSWKNVKGAESYAVFKKTEGSKWKKVATVKNATNYTYTLGTLSKTVYFKVKALKGNISSATSDVEKTRKVDPTKPMVALTYDDGPHGTHTMKILSLLEKYGGRATFFVVGSRIEYYPQCLKKAADLGCEVGNHTYGHISLSSSSASKIQSDITKTDNLIKKYTGITPTLMRAPGGSVGKSLSIVDRPFIQWSVDTRDWESRNTSSIVSIVKRQVRDGSIILMHDIYSTTASASEILIPWLIDEGYQLVTVTELIKARNTELTGGKIYYNGYKAS